MFKEKPWLRFVEGSEGGNVSAPVGEPSGVNTDPEEESQEPAGGSEGSGGDAGGESVLSRDDALKELERVRREAARYRTERNELRDKASKSDEAAGAELKDALARIEALEVEKQAAEQSAVRAKVAAVTGVDAEFIQGDTEEQMTDYATRLKESMKQSMPHVPPPGQSGAPESDPKAYLDRIRGAGK